MIARWVGSTLVAAKYFLSLTNNKIQKLRPSLTSSQHLLSEERHPFLDFPSLSVSRRGVWNLEKISGLFLMLVISVPNHGSLLSLKSSREHKQTEELKPGAYNQFCKLTEMANRIAHWLTPDKFVCCTNTVKESPGHLSYCSADQGAAVGAGTFAASATNQLLDNLEADSLDRSFLTLNYMLQPGKDARGETSYLFPELFVHP